MVEKSRVEKFMVEKFWFEKSGVEMSFNLCTEVRFVRFLSGGFTTMAVINPPDWKLANHTSVRFLGL